MCVCVCVCACVCVLCACVWAYVCHACVCTCFCVCTQHGARVHVRYNTMPAQKRIRITICNATNLGFRSPLDLFLFHIRSIKRLSQANSNLNLVGHLLSAIIEVNNAADLQRRTLWGAPMHDIHMRTYVHM